MKNSINQAIRFIIVGASNTLVGYLSYVLIVWILSSYYIRYDYIIANILSFIISIHWAFVLNKMIVFKANNWRNSYGKELVKTYLTYGFSGFVLNNILLYLFVDICEISKYYAPILNLMFLVPFNYFVNKYWIFHNKLGN